MLILSSSFFTLNNLSVSLFELPPLPIVLVPISRRGSLFWFSSKGSENQNKQQCIAQDSKKFSKDFNRILIAVFSKLNYKHLECIKPQFLLCQSVVPGYCSFVQEIVHTESFLRFSSR